MSYGPGGAARCLTRKCRKDRRIDGRFRHAFLRRIRQAGSWSRAMPADKGMLKSWIGYFAQNVYFVVSMMKFIGII
ncbi:hypothetical protein ACKC5Q_23285, partial [Aeromonas dhakensis]|uniref:hypothetical protein n=1 Tax=Aeromonas dhakensis TaxID=196024 RepID=UPI0038B4A7E4